MIRRDIGSFFIWIRSSQAPVYIAALYLVIGVLVLRYRPWLHEYFMVLGVRLFYVTVMWGQVPGFSGAMPHPVLSIVVVVSETLGALLGVLWPESLLWQVFLWTASIAHTIQYLPRGLGTTMRTMPNILTVSGLLFTLTTPLTGYIGVMAFPLASVSSLLLRVDPSMRRRRIGVSRVAVYTAVFIASYTALLATGYRELVLVPVTTLPLLLPWLGGRDIYRIGTTVSKIFALVSLPLSLVMPWQAVLHLVFIGFLGVTMASLCTPLLVPGIVWREVPRIGLVESIAIVSILSISTVARVLGAYTGPGYTGPVSGVLVVLVVVYYVYRILRTPRVVVRL